MSFLPLSLPPGYCLLPYSATFLVANSVPDVKEFIPTCPTCTQSKSSRKPPFGLLRLLPVPHCPWSHISLDFVTGLPPFNNHTTILTVVDHFSKMVHFIPLSKLPSAKEMADLLIHHIFHLHGNPQDIVTDRGPQFTAKYWADFCCLLWITVSLVIQLPP